MLQYNLTIANDHFTAIDQTNDLYLIKKYAAVIFSYRNNISLELNCG